MIKATDRNAELDIGDARSVVIQLVDHRERLALVLDTNLILSSCLGKILEEEVVYSTPVSLARLRGDGDCKLDGVGVNDCNGEGDVAVEPDLARYDLNLCRGVLWTLWQSKGELRLLDGARDHFDRCAI